MTVKRVFLLTPVLAAAALWAAAGPKTKLNVTDPDFFTTAEAARIGRQVVAYQRDTGGWPKNTDMTRQLSEAQLDSVRACKGRRNDSTTDNDATTTQMAYLARLYKATGDSVWAASLRRGAEYLMSGQYDNGGWPQFWPVQRNYQVHITYNDNAMTNAMTLIRDLRDGRPPYDAPGLTDERLRALLDTAFTRGVRCILATQITGPDGEPEVWCQQHDRNTLKPVGARAFELPAYSSTESASIVWLLMEIPEPDEAVCRAIEGAMRWFERTRIDGYRYERRGPEGTRLVADSTSAVWARYYDLEECRPFVCDRDGIPRRSLDEIGRERRDGYSWYSPWPALLFPKYEEWKRRTGRR